MWSSGSMYMENKRKPKIDSYGIPQVRGAALDKILPISIVRLPSQKPETI